MQTTELTAYPSGPAAPEGVGAEDLLPYLLDMVAVEEKRADYLMRVVIPLGAALVGETDFDHLLERIVLSAMAMCRADAGTLYLRGDEECLKVALMRRESTGVAMGGTSGKVADGPAVSLAGVKVGDAAVLLAAQAAVSGRSVSEFGDWADASARRVGSGLAVPLKGAGGRVVGVLELLDARREGRGGDVVAFETGVQRAVEALSLLAAAALGSYVRQKELKEQVRQLRVQVDGERKTKQVEAIVGSEYFRSLKARANDLRSGAAAKSGGEPLSGG